MIQYIRTRFLPLYIVLFSFKDGLGRGGASHALSFLIYIYLNDISMSFFSSLPLFLSSFCRSHFLPLSSKDREFVEDHQVFGGDTGVQLFHFLLSHFIFPLWRNPFFSFLDLMVRSVGRFWVGGYQHGSLLAFFLFLCC